MLLSCYIILVKLENFLLSKIFGMTYNLERMEYVIPPPFNLATVRHLDKEFTESTTFDPIPRY